MKLYNFILFLITFLFTILFLTLYVTNSVVSIIPRYVYYVISISLSVGYLFVYRRNNFFCYETLFLIVYILGVFFVDFVLNSLRDDSVVSWVLFRKFSETIELKGLLLQILCLLFFLSGSVLGFNTKRSQLTVHPKTPNPKFVVYGSALYMLYLYFTGVIQTWFHYSEDAIVFTNTEIVYITTFLLSATVLEFYRLYRLKIDNVKDFFRNINKVYLAEIIILSFLLLISGNRNESLLVFVPPVLCFSLLIKEISNKKFVLGIILGGILMIFIGLTRGEGVKIDSLGTTTIELYGMTRDYGVIDLNTRYLIWYTDMHSPIYFNNAFGNLISSVPFLGGFVSSMLSLTPDPRSTIVTTMGMQDVNNNSGLGTSLVGDLYYTGGALFSILFMFLLGFIITKIFNKIKNHHGFNLYELAFLVFNVSNVVYFVRAEWTMPLRYIGFSFVLIFLSQLFFSKIEKNEKDSFYTTWI